MNDTTPKQPTVAQKIEAEIAYSNTKSRELSNEIERLERAKAIHEARINGLVAALDIVMGGE